MTWHRKFFSALLILLPTQLGLHFWPEWTMILGRRVDYLSPTLYLTDILIFFTISSWFLSSRDPAQRGVAISYIYMRLLRFARNDRVRKATVVIITPLLFAALNISFAVSMPAALYKWIKVVEFLLLGFYVVRTKPKISFVTFYLSIGALYSSLLAITQFFLQRSVGGPLWWLGERTFIADTPGIARAVWYGRELLRPYATFPHPNVLGGFLAVVLPLLIISREAGSRSARQFSIFKIITIVLGLIALVLTFSRSAIAVGIIVMASIFLIRRRFTLFIFAAAIIVSLFTFHFSLFTPLDESIVVRQQLNAAAIKLWQTSPLFGVGLGNFLVRLPDALPSRTIYFLQPVHNIYLLVLAETGVVGVAMVILFAWGIAHSAQCTVHSAQKKQRSFSFSAVHFSLCTLLLLGLVDHYPLTLQQGQVLLTILIAMSYN